MPFRGVEKYDAHRAGYCNFPRLTAGGMRGISRIGARFIAPQTVLQAFLHFEPQNFDHNVIVRLRLPRLAAALLTGASLGVAGALLQAVIRNPLGSHIF